MHRWFRPLSGNSEPLRAVVTEESLFYDMHRCAGKLMSQLKICKWVEGLNFPAGPDQGVDQSYREIKGQWLESETPNGTRNSFLASL